MNMKNILLPLFISILFSTLGCWDEPLLTELGTNRLEVRLKGTYASNSPRDWIAMTGANYQQYVMDDSIDDMPYITDEEFPTLLKFDIAEIRLEAANGKISKFARYRKTFKVEIDTTNAAPDPFFSGEGVVMKNDDPVPGREYVKVHVYFRKILFDKAKYYEIYHTGTGSSKVYDYDAGWMTTADYSGDNLINSIFAENEEEGFDFNLRQLYYFWDTFRQEQESTNRVFSLEIPIEGGLIFDNKTDKTVLEIRLAMKNFIKKYEYDSMTYAPSYADNLAAPVIAHYYAMSDWLRDARAGENYIGGNLHGIARSYVDGETGTISGTTTADGYVIAIPSSADIANYFIDLNGAESLRDRYVTDACEPPVYPSAPAASINAYMDYLLKYEEYRVGWDRFSTDCPAGAADTAEMQNFVEAWHAYDGTSDDEDNYDLVDDGFTLSGDGATRGFTLPPYAVYSESGAFTINDIAPGTYKVYFVPFANTAANYGKLFDDSITMTSGVYSASTDIPVDSGDALTLDSNLP